MQLIIGFTFYIMFPYYIVRFKRIKFNSVCVVVYEFPYYIVRFKRVFEKCTVILIDKFPYYIVRFKLFFPL